MPWTDKPGSGANGSGNGKGPTKGPWGQPSGDGRGPRPVPGTGNGSGRKPGQNAPDLEELLRSGRERFRKGGRGGGTGTGRGAPQLPSKAVLGLGAAAVAALWLASGFYQVQPGERGVVTTFGDFATLSDSGLNWHVPWPVQDVTKVDVQNDRAVTIGRGNDKVSMLTSDLNIVEVDMQVNYRIKDDADTPPGELPNAAKYVFNIGPEEVPQLVRASAEAALREVVGGEEFGPIISRGRAIVTDQTLAILQDTLDSYDSGIEVIRINFGQADPPGEVIASQRDVVDARSEFEQKINVANGYANRQVPVARGEARQTVLDAEAYAAQVVAEARGDAARFVDIYDEYAKAPEVTRQRMYLETMERVLGDMNKVVIDQDAGGAVPLLDVNTLAASRQQRATRDERANRSQGGN